MTTTTATTEIDADAALDRYLQLTAIDGISRDESAIGAAILKHLRDAGIPKDQIAIDDAGQKTDPPGNHGNIIVTLPGNDSLPRTMLSAHMDTVPTCLGSRPHREGDDIVSSDPATGLGADDRAGCAAILSAIVQRQSSAGDHPPAVVVFLVQEEIGLRGAKHLDRDLVGRVDRAFNFDGSSPQRLIIGAIGGERMTIEVTGLPAHAGVAPQTGVSAIVIAARAIAALDADGWLGRVDRDGGTGTANIGVIHGGAATNVITPSVQLRAEARSHDAEFRTAIVNAIRNAFETAAADVTNDTGQSGRTDLDSTVDYESFRLPDDHRSITAARQQIEALGRTAEIEISNGGLDANWLYRHGIESITLGCGQRNIHTAEERLHIPDYLAAVQIATNLLVGGAED